MSSKIKYLLFDAANTLIHKPKLWENIDSTLKRYGLFVDKQKLMYNHKLLSETIRFPDRTDTHFYSNFNAELLYSLGIVPNEELLENLFSACTYLPWESFDDCKELVKIPLPKAILSNFKSSLSETILEKVNVAFETIITSEIEQLRKPQVEFYELAVKRLNVKSEEILYIGDSIKLDYEPAIKIGINVLVIDRINFYLKHNFVISNFSEIKNYI